MLTEILPSRFALDATTIAGAGLWSLALYLGFFELSELVTVQLNRWFDNARRSLSTSESEFETTRPGSRVAQNSLYASLLSIVPFFLAGILLNYGVEISLGRSWAISVGIIACIGGGIYELGRRDGQSS